VNGERLTVALLWPAFDRYVTARWC